MKRIIAILLTCILACSLLILPVCAAEEQTVQPRYLDIYSFYISFDISSSGTALCETSVSTTTQTNTIYLTMNLEQYNGTRWVILKTWTGNFGPDADMTKYRAVPSGYDYRVSVSAAVYDADGNAVETVGRYSGTIHY